MLQKFKSYDAKTICRPRMFHKQPAEHGTLQKSQCLSRRKGCFRLSRVVMFCQVCCKPAEEESDAEAGALRLSRRVRSYRKPTYSSHPSPWRGCTHLRALNGTTANKPITTHSNEKSINRPQCEYEYCPKSNISRHLWANPRDPRRGHDAHCRRSRQRVFNIGPKNANKVHTSEQKQTASFVAVMAARTTKDGWIMLPRLRRELFPLYSS